LIRNEKQRSGDGYTLVSKPIDPPGSPDPLHTDNVEIKLAGYTNHPLVALRYE